MLTTRLGTPQKLDPKNPHYLIRVDGNYIIESEKVGSSVEDWCHNNVETSKSKLPVAWYGRQDLLQKIQHLWLVLFGC